jgi:hypothetical protein
MHEAYVSAYSRKHEVCMPATYSANETEKLIQVCHRRLFRMLGCKVLLSYPEFRQQSSRIVNSHWQCRGCSPTPGGHRPWTAQSAV